MCVYIKWFWKFCNILDINFTTPDPYSVEEFWGGQSKSQEKFLHVVGTKKKQKKKIKKKKKRGTTFRFIIILLNTAEDLLCIYRTVSKALYCCSVYCIFITFKKYTTMSRACISFY